MLLQQLQKTLQRDRFRDGEDLRPRRHHLAHQHVAKLHRRAHQFAVALFQNAFLFAGLDQRLHIRRGLLFGAGRLLRQRRHGKEEADEHRDRRHQPQQQAR